MTDRHLELPSSFAATRDALHTLVELVISPARAAVAAGEFSLEATPDGFGTPPLPDGSVIRVEGAELIVQPSAGEERRQSISSLQAAANFVGLAGVDLDDTPLKIDGASSLVLGSAFALANDVLLELRDEAAASADASPIRLWPEHFDIAFEQGDEAAGQRAGYGLSPGDEAHPEPYFYVGPWQAPADLSEWNAEGFTGAELRWNDLLASDDPRSAALAFLRDRRDALQSA